MSQPDEDDDRVVQWGSDAAQSFRDEIQSAVATAASKHGVTMLELAAVLQYVASRAWFFLSPEHSKLDGE